MKEPLSPLDISNVEIGTCVIEKTRVTADLRARLNDEDTEALIESGMLPNIGDDIGSPEDASPIYFIREINLISDDNEHVIISASVLNGLDHPKIEKLSLLTIYHTAPLTFIIKKSTLAIMRAHNSIPEMPDSVHIFADTEYSQSEKPLIVLQFPPAHATRLWNELRPMLHEITSRSLAHDDTDLTMGNVPQIVRTMQSDVYKTINSMVRGDSIQAHKDFVDSYGYLFDTSDDHTMRDEDEKKYLMQLVENILAGAQSSITTFMLSKNQPEEAPKKSDIDSIFESIITNSFTDEETEWTHSCLAIYHQWEKAYDPLRNGLIPINLLPLFDYFENTDKTGILEGVKYNLLDHATKHSTDMSHHDVVRDHLLDNVFTSSEPELELVIVQLIQASAFLNVLREEQSEQTFIVNLNRLVGISLSGRDDGYGWEYEGFINDLIDGETAGFTELLLTAYDFHDHDHDFDDDEDYDVEQYAPYIYLIPVLTLVGGLLLSDEIHVEDVESWELPSHVLNDARNLMFSLIDGINQEVDVESISEYGKHLAQIHNGSLYALESYGVEMIAEILPYVIIAIAESSSYDEDPEIREESFAYQIAGILRALANNMTEGNF